MQNNVPAYGGKMGAYILYETISSSRKNMSIELNNKLKFKFIYFCENFFKKKSNFNKLCLFILHLIILERKVL
jgi:hypothetical protein